MAAEKALGIAPTERADWIRMMSEEFQRLASHIMWYAAFVQDLGLMSPFLYGMRDRDLILDLFQSYTGGRLTYEYMRVGGVRNDLPEGFTGHARQVLDWLEPRFVEYDRLCMGSDIFRRRCDGLGVLSANDCVPARGDRPDAPIGRVETRPPEGPPVLRATPRSSSTSRPPTPRDVTGRYLVRMEEMRQSVRILRQALDWLDSHPGPVLADHLPRWLGAPYAPIGREAYLLKRNYPKGVGLSAIEEPHGEALRLRRERGRRAPVPRQVPLPGVREPQRGPPLPRRLPRRRHSTDHGQRRRVRRRGRPVGRDHGADDSVGRRLLASRPGSSGSSARIIPPLASPLANGDVIWGLSALVFGAILLAASMINTIMLIWFERKMLGRFMDRRGAMHVGYAGLLQNFADGLKLFRKNTFKPREADELGFYAGPDRVHGDVAAHVRGPPDLHRVVGRFAPALDAARPRDLQLRPAVHLHLGLVEQQQVLADGRNALGRPDDRLRGPASSSPSSRWSSSRGAST